MGYTSVVHNNDAKTLAMPPRSDENFTGECRTFESGDYGTLSAALRKGLSSGRRIRDQYPYSQSPNWQPR